MSKRRAVAAAAAAVGLVLGVSGCNTSALTKRELVVYFADNASQAEHRAALTACAHATPSAHPEPFVEGNLASDSVGDIRFRIDHTDDHDLAILYACLNKQPGVKGVDIPDLTD
jgi:hypothetical protein